MAAFFGNRLVLPIGCTCISDVQLQMTPGARIAPYFFDWAGTTIAATIEILNRSGTPFVEHEGDLEVHNGRVRAKNVRGVHFWHINSFFGMPVMQEISSLADHAEGLQKFIHYHRMVMSRLNGDHEEIHCLWNNIQPNLLLHAELAGEPRSGYFLTAERYAAIKETCKQRLRARKIAVWFVCHRDDLDDSLVGKDDVTVLDVPRSPTEWKGPPGLLGPVLDKMGIRVPEQYALSDLTIWRPNRR
jgi:hypothetical protein